MRPPSSADGVLQSRAVAAAAVALFALPGSAGAEIHDYMILRLVYLETSCGTEHLARIAAPEPQRRFRITCRNTSAYPEGLVITCNDPLDDRSCRIETKSQEFRHLELLRRKGE